MRYRAGYSDPSSTATTSSVASSIARAMRVAVAAAAGQGLEDQRVQGAVEEFGEIGRSPCLDNQGIGVRRTVVTIGCVRTFAVETRTMGVAFQSERGLEPARSRCPHRRSAWKSIDRAFIASLGGAAAVASWTMRRRPKRSSTTWKTSWTRWSRGPAAREIPDGGRDRSADRDAPVPARHGLRVHRPARAERQEDRADAGQADAEGLLPSCASRRPTTCCRARRAR